MAGWRLYDLASTVGSPIHPAQKPVGFDSPPPGLLSFLHLLGEWVRWRLKPRTGWSGGWDKVGSCLLSATCTLDACPSPPPATSALGCPARAGCEQGLGSLLRVCPSSKAFGTAGRAPHTTYHTTRWPRPLLSSLGARPSPRAAHSSTFLRRAATGPSLGSGGVARAPPTGSGVAGAEDATGEGRPPPLPGARGLEGACWSFGMLSTGPGPCLSGESGEGAPLMSEGQQPAGC